MAGSNIYKMLKHKKNPPKPVPNLRQGDDSMAITDVTEDGNTNEKLRAGIAAMVILGEPRAKSRWKPRI